MTDIFEEFGWVYLKQRKKESRLLYKGLKGRAHILTRMTLFPRIWPVETNIYWPFRCHMPGLIVTSPDTCPTQLGIGMHSSFIHIVGRGSRGYHHKVYLFDSVKILVLIVPRLRAVWTVYYPDSERDRERERERDGTIMKKKKKKKKTTTNNQNLEILHYICSAWM